MTLGYTRAAESSKAHRSRRFPANTRVRTHMMRTLKMIHRMSDSEVSHPLLRRALPERCRDFGSSFGFLLDGGDLSALEVGDLTERGYDGGRHSN